MTGAGLEAEVSSAGPEPPDGSRTSGTLKVRAPPQRAKKSPKRAEIYLPAQRPKGDPARAMGVAKTPPFKKTTYPAGKLFLRQIGRLLVTQRTDQADQFDLLTPVGLVPMHQHGPHREPRRHWPCRKCIHGGKLPFDRTGDGKNTTASEPNYPPGAALILAPKSRLSIIRDSFHKLLSQ
jgi:hypothetical protein